MVEKIINVAIITRADGTVPFDPGLDPQVKSLIIGHLEKQGHELEHCPHGTHVKICGYEKPA